jgi:tight adherence protein C
MSAIAIVVGVLFTLAVIILVRALRPLLRGISPVDRLRKMSPAMVEEEEGELKGSFFHRAMLPMAEKLAGFFKAWTPNKAMADARQMISEAGMTGKVTEAQVVGLSWMAGIGLPTLFWILYGPAPLDMMLKVMAIFISGMLGFRLPGIIIGGRAKKRKEQIIKDLPFALDLLSISVEAGMGFDGALAAVGERSRGALADEIGHTLTEVRLGKPRDQALMDLGNRTGVDDLKTFVGAVCFVSQLGGSLSSVLKVQAEALRVRRRQRAEEKAMKAPVKMMMPLVLFIFPAIFIVILVPGLIQLKEGLAKQ